MLVVAGDLAWLEAEALRRLSWFAGGGVAVPLHGDGFVEALLQLYDGGLEEACRGIAFWCRSRGRLRATDPLRSTTAVFVGSSLLSHTASTFTHVNRVEDLLVKGGKGPLGAKGVVRVGGVWGTRTLHGRRLCRVLRLEAHIYASKGLRLLARHALEDYRLLCRPTR